MDYKEVFLNSINEEQLGFFCVHEYDDNIEDLLQDHISVKQFALYSDWKNHEIALKQQKSSKASNFDASALVSKLDSVASLLTALSKRIDGIESRLIKSEQHTVEKIASLEENLKNKIVKLSQISKANFNSMENERNEAAKDIYQLKEEQTKVVSSLAKQLEQSSTRVTSQQTEMKQTLSEVARRIDDVDNQTKKISQNILPSFDSEDLAKKWLDKLLEQAEVSDLSEEKKTEIGSKDNIKKIVSLMKKFKDIEDIESKGLEILRLFFKPVFKFSSAVRTVIAESRVLDYFIELFKKNWYNRKEELVIYILLIFVNSAEDKDTRIYLLKDSYIETFLLPLSNAVFSKCHLYSGWLLGELNKIDDSDWNIKTTKSEIGDFITNNMRNWPLGQTENIRFYKFAWLLIKIIADSVVYARFNAWVITNALMVDPTRNVDLMKKEEVIPKMEAILADTNTDPEVRKLIEKSLGILKK